MTIQKDRSRFNQSNERLRRARRHYALLVRRWIEKARDQVVFRARAYRCATRAIEAGLWKVPNKREAVFGILGHWRRSDRMGWWPWRNADQRRGVALDWERGFQDWLAARKKRKA